MIQFHLLASNDAERPQQNERLRCAERADARPPEHVGTRFPLTNKPARVNVQNDASGMISPNMSARCFLQKISRITNGGADKTSQSSRDRQG